MTAKGFDEGATSPLLFTLRSLVLAAGVLLLAACSRPSSLPPFTASGYAADQGAVRIWRKDDNTDAIRMLVVVSPWRTGNTTTSEYRWQGDVLSLIETNIYGKTPEHVKVRFDDRGELSFMQREVDGQKQQLSDDSIALYRYQAQQMRSTSDALRTGHVVLKQGRWHADRTVTTCEGQTIRPSFDTLAIDRIERRQAHSSLEVSVAWLEAPDGVQLLLVANQDYCNWQPKADSF